MVIFSVLVSTVFGFLLSKRLLNSKPSGIQTLQSSTVKHSFELVEKEQISDHVIRLRFKLPSAAHVLGLTIGRHITVSAMIVNPLNETERLKYFARQYTPITNDYEDKGYFDLVVKVYRKNDHPKFPEGGWMSQYLDSLSIGSSIDVRGPNGRIQYLEKGSFKIGQISLKARHIAMIAGGTGVTPMYQLIRHLEHSRSGQDGIKLSLLFGNQHPGDILLRSELEAFPDLALNLTVDRVDPGEEWQGHTGFVDETMIKSSFPKPSSDVLVLLCGPPPMVRSLEVLLLNLGYDKSRIYAF